jgi:hypothetical protein
MLMDRQDRLWFADPNWGLCYLDKMEVTNISRQGPLHGWSIQDIELRPTSGVRVVGVRRSNAGVERQSFDCTTESVTPIEGK